MELVQKASHKASSIYAKYGPNFGLHLDMMDKRLRRILKITESQDTWGLKVPLVQFCLLKAVSVRAWHPGPCCQVFKNWKGLSPQPLKSVEILFFCWAILTVKKFYLMFKGTFIYLSSPPLTCLSLDTTERSPSLVLSFPPIRYLST